MPKCPYGRFRQAWDMAPLKVRPIVAVTWSHTACRSCPGSWWSSCLEWVPHTYEWVSEFMPRVSASYLILLLDCSHCSQQPVWPWQWGVLIKLPHQQGRASCVQTPGSHPTLAIGAGNSFQLLVYPFHKCIFFLIDICTTTIFEL